MQNKMPGGSLLLAGLVAFAYYKYSKLSPNEKSNLVATIKEKGKKLYDQYFPGQLKNFFESKDTFSYKNDFENGSEFVG